MILPLLLLIVPNGFSQDDKGDSKILGGFQVRKGEFAFVVSIQEWGSHQCGGSLLTKSLVLTAAHCIVDPEKYIAGGGKNPALLNVRAFSIVAGTINVENPEETEQIRRVIRSYCHPEAEKELSGWLYDVGLLVTDRPFNLVPRVVRTVSLPKEVHTEQLIADEAKCIALGWGALFPGGFYSSTLQKVTLKLKHQSYCETAIGKAAAAISAKFKFTRNAQICTLGRDNKDACSGDSGGPLLCVIEKLPNRTQELTGVCSWGSGCGEPDTPGVWARLDRAKEWIRKILRAESAIRQSIIPISSHRSRSDQIRTESTSSVVVFTVISLWCINAINTIS